jgi:diguanylate cyclase (GGDEF)-like protein
MGGDELLVVLTSAVTRALVEQVGQRLRTVIAEPVVMDRLEERTTASIGGVVGQRHDGPDHLVALADAAMYLAKQSGRDRVVLVD